MLNKAKTTVDALVSWDCLMPEHQKLFNAIQDKICRLQPIIEFLNNFITYDHSSALKSLFYKNLKYLEIGLSAELQYY